MGPYEPEPGRRHREEPLREAENERLVRRLRNGGREPPKRVGRQMSGSRGSLEVEAR